MWDIPLHLLPLSWYISSMRLWSITLLSLTVPVVVAGMAGVFAGGGGDGSVEPAPVPQGLLAWKAPERLNRMQLLKAAETIDRLVLDDLEANGITAQPEISPERLVRRMYLDVAGRIPSIDEAHAFVSDASPDRIAALADRLLGSPAHVQHEFTFWADLLRLGTRLGGGRYPGQSYLDWVKDAIRRNTPYDELVRSLVLASGPAMAPDQGATGFWLRDAGMPLDHLSNTVRAFLGTRIGCAQCHDHPFDTWKRHDFYALAAFTNGTQVRRDLPGEGPIKRQLRDEPPAIRLAMRSIGDVVAVAVRAPKQPTIPVPQDWQYDDAKPGGRIDAGVLYGDAPAPAAKSDPRTVFADWLTSPENPRFRLTIVNRLWKRWMGQGLIEPVDQLTDTTSATNPALAEFLGQLLWSLDDDVRAFERIVLTTRTYRRATVGEPEASQPFRFAGPATRRMTAEQLWDSLLVLTVADPDGRQGDTAESLHQFYVEHHDQSPDELIALARQLGTVRQQARELQEQIVALRKPGWGNRPEIKAQLRDLTQRRRDLLESIDSIKVLTRQLDKGKQDALLRAAELPQPAQPGHFLRVFGQSDRELIDNGNRAATVPQALFLLNGLVDQQIVQSHTPLMKGIAAMGTSDGKIDVLWQATLTRDPTAHERDLARGAFARNPKEAVSDLVWALVNSEEFRAMP